MQDYGIQDGLSCKGRLRSMRQLLCQNALMILFPQWQRLLVIEALKLEKALQSL